MKYLLRSCIHMRRALCLHQLNVRSDAKVITYHQVIGLIPSSHQRTNPQSASFNRSFSFYEKHFEKARKPIDFFTNHATLIRKPAILAGFAALEPFCFFKRVSKKCRTTRRQKSRKHHQIDALSYIFMREA